MYQDIRLPFWCQTRPETITEYRVQRLKEMGCARISFGVEHGNEDYRAKFLNRKMKNQVITDGLNIVAKGGIPFSVNNIIGFPNETRELAFDTIRLNKTFQADDRNAYPFTPFTGTPLRKISEELGLVSPSDVVQSMVAHGSIIDMPQFPRTEVNGLVKTFNMYVAYPGRMAPYKRGGKRNREAKSYMLSFEKITFSGFGGATKPATLLLRTLR